MTLRRRDVLAGAAAVLTACRGDEAPTGGCEAAPLSAGPDLQGVEALATWLTEVDEAALVPELRSRLEAGGSLEAEYAGLLLAGARGIDSIYGGGGFHQVLQVQALRHASALAPADEELVPLAYGLLTARGSLLGSSWALPATGVGTGSIEVLLDAARIGDVDTALAEVSALLPARSALREALLELGCRRAWQLGHEGIAAGKVLAALDELPGPWSEDVWRSVAYMFTSAEKLPPGPSYAEVWDESLARASCEPLDGRDDPDAPLEVALALRGQRDPLAALDLVERTLAEGGSARSIWDGLVLAAAEAAHGSANYHAFTSVQALRDSHLLATTDRVRRLILLQGAAWVALAAQTDAAPGVPLLDVELAAATLDEVLASSGSGSVELALGHLADGGDEQLYVDAVLALARRSATDEHHYKLVHAALLEAERVPASWRPYVLACARLYAPTSASLPNDAWTSVMG